MSLSTVTSKGQITIPKSVRDSLHLRTGDRVEFIILEDNKVLLRPITKKSAEVFGRLHKSDRKSVSTEAMKAAIRKRHQVNNQ